MSEKKKNEEYYCIKSILEALPEVTVQTKRGGHLRFPIYMTDSMARTDIEVLDLSVRSYNCLKRAGISTLGELCERVHCSGDLQAIRNCGKTSVAEIMDNLFCYQFLVLKPEKQGRFLAKVLQMNAIEPGVK